MSDLIVRSKYGPWLLFPEHGAAMMLAVPELLPEIVEVFVSVPRTQDSLATQQPNKSKRSVACGRSAMLTLSPLVLV